MHAGGRSGRRRRRGGRRRGVETRRARRRPDLERRGGEARCAGEAAGGAEFDLGLRRGGEARRARGRPKLERRGGGRSWSEARRRPERSELELVRQCRAGERGGRGQDCGLISLKFEGFFAKHPKNARSGPSIRPIRRPGAAGDVARSQARELARNRES